MKKIILFAAFALPTLTFAQTTTTYIGTVKDLATNVVTSGKITWTQIPSTISSTSGVGIFVPTVISCGINASGSPVNISDGVSACVVTNNTALTPTSTAYKMCIQPFFASDPNACIVTYASGGTVDISMLVPTPATMPNYGVASDATVVHKTGDEAIAGNKTFTGIISAGPTSLDSSGVHTSGIISAGPTSLDSNGVHASGIISAGPTSLDSNGVHALAINSAQYVGSGSNSTIQAAITAAGSTGSVVIPSNYAGTDTYTNPANIQITDLRPYNAANTVAQMLSAYPLMNMAAGGNAAQAGKCVNSSACTVVFWGDSITEGISQVAYENNWVSTVQNSLRQHYSAVAWNFLNYALGGMGSANAVDASFTCQNPGTGNHFWRTASLGSPGGDNAAYSVWPMGCTSGNSWKQHVHDAAPDVVFVAFGANDAGLGVAAEVANLNALITYMNSFPKPPTIVLVTNTEATQLNPTYAALNPVLLQMMQAQRDLGAQLNIPVMDAGRLYLLFRDGTDYAHSRFTMEPDFLGWGTARWTQTGSTSAAGGVLSVGTGGGLAILNHTGTDFVATGQFSAMTIGATQATSSYLTYNYRLSNGAADKYALQITRCNASCAVPNLVQIALYWNSTTITYNNGTSAASTLTLWGRVIGAHHQWYVLDGTTLVASIDAYDYSYLGPGVSAVGCELYGCTISYFRDYLGNPQTILAAPNVPEATLIGINDWYPANQANSMGGDAIHHPSAIGHDVYYAAAFAPVLTTFDRAVATNAQQLQSHIRFASCSTGATIGSYCDDSPQSWAAPFADTSYTVSCSVTGASGIPAVSLIGKTASTIQTRLVTNFNGVSSGTVECMAIHDN